MRQFVIFFLFDNKEYKQYCDNNIHYIPHRPSQRNLYEWLKKQCKRTKCHRQCFLLFLIIVVCKNRKAKHCHKPDKYIVAVGQVQEAKKQKYGEDKFEVFHSFNILRMDIILNYIECSFIKLSFQFWIFIQITRSVKPSMIESVSKIKP